MGGKSRYPYREPLNCYATLRGIIESGVTVKASCDRCKLWKVVDVPALVETLGLDGSLVDRHPPCPTVGCSGRVLFSYSTGPSTMFRPMTTGRRDA